MSMPVTNLDRRGRENLPDLASVLGHIDTTGYLFGEDDKEHNAAASPDHKAYLQMSNTNDKFPILVRRGDAGTCWVLSRLVLGRSWVRMICGRKGEVVSCWVVARTRFDGTFGCVEEGEGKKIRLDVW